MKKGLVSICIPTYKRPDYLQKAITSALNQTYTHCEIIITDNDDSRKTLEPLLKRNKTIRYYKNKKNIGSVNNLQQAASFARGEYIKFLLDDDLLYPTCIEKMVSVMEKSPSVGLVMAPLDIIDEKGEKCEPLFYLVKKMKYLYRYLNISMRIPKEKILKDFLTTVYPCCVPTGFMVRNSLFKQVGGLKSTWSYVADLELCMHCATHSDFYYINEVLSSWRYTPSSETVSILHKKGVNPAVFYRLTKKYSVYCKGDRQKAYLFASKRTAINISAGIKTFNFSLVIKTIKTIFENDPYIMNKLILPFSLLEEVLAAQKNEAL